MAGTAGAGSAVLAVGEVACAAGATVELQAPSIAATTHRPLPDRKRVYMEISSGVEASA